MTRPTLLAATVALSLVTFSPSAFSAAVVHKGSLIGSKEMGSARFSLASRTLDGRLTLAGAPAEVAGPTLALPEQLSEIAACAPVPASVSSPAPAPDGVGSASAFGAVPEPSSLALLALGACSLLRRRRN